MKATWNRSELKPELLRKPTALLQARELPGARDASSALKITSAALYGDFHFATSFK